MRATISVLLVLTVAGAFLLGRWQDPPVDADLATIDSFRSAFHQGNALERSYRFHGFLQSMGPDEVAQAAEQVDRWNPWLVADELRNFMVAWAAFDAPAALDWGLARTGSFRPQAAGAALDGWAFHDPVSARLALKSLDRATAPSGLEESVVAGWLSGGRHEGVVEFIEEQPPGLLRQRYTNLLTIELMRESPNAVIRWAESLEDDGPDGYKTMAFQKAANILASADPVLASTWIETHLQSDYAKRSPSAISQRWLEIDAAAALDWLASLPAGEHDKDLRRTLLTWLNQAPEEAEAWVRDSSPAPGLDVPVELMISRNRHDPRAMIEWALRLHDSVEKHQVVLRLARKWKRNDREALDRWLEQSELSPKMKRAVLGPGTPATPPASPSGSEQ